MRSALLAAAVLLAAPALAQTASTNAAALRDPFWPVGYTPAAVAPSAPADNDEVKTGLLFENLTEEQQAIFRQKLKVTGFLRTGKGYVARINNQLVGANDTVTVDFQGQAFTFRVRMISADSVQLEPRQ